MAKPCVCVHRILFPADLFKKPITDRPYVRTCYSCQQQQRHAEMRMEIIIGFFPSSSTDMQESHRSIDFHVYYCWHGANRVLYSSQTKEPTIGSTGMAYIILPNDGKFWLVQYLLLYL